MTGSRGSVSIVTPSFYPMIGGIESYVRGLGKELMKLGYGVHVFTPNSVMKRKLEPSEESVDGIEVHRIPVLFDLSYRLKFWPGLVEALQQRQGDIVHVYSHDLYATSAAQAAKKMGVPLLMTTYGPFQSHSDYGALKGAALNGYDSLVTPRLFRACSTLFIRYPELEEWAASYGVERRRIVLEPSAIPSEYLRRTSTGLTGIGSPRILYLGRVSPQKGVQHAVAAMKLVKRRFPDAKLLVVGPDYASYTGHLLRLAESLGVEKNVGFAGPVTDPAEEAAIISSCDLSVMPSSFEGFSQAVMKAMALGKPCVVTSVGGLPYEVDYGRCGLICDYGDAAGLADRIMDLLSSPELSSRLAVYARLWAAQFTFESSASRVSNQYEKVIAAYA